MGLLATATTIGSVHHCTIEASERRGTAMGARTARKRLSEGKDEERGKEYCKLLLPLVSCLERWIVCLLPRRTRYCATYLRTHPRQKSSSISSLSSSSQHRRCRLRPVIAVLPGCNRSGTSKEVLLGKKRASSTLANPSLFYSILQFPFFVQFTFVC